MIHSASFHTKQADLDAGADSVKLVKMVQLRLGTVGKTNITTNDHEEEYGE